MTDTGIEQWEHRWLFVIIPVERPYSTSDFYRYGSAVIFNAYCKECDGFFSKEVYETNSNVNKLGLPRFGCIGPAGRF